mgnify:CR=1 FL=1
MPSHLNFLFMQIKKDDEVFISEGEEFIVTHKPEDNFLERPAPEDADLELTWVNIGGIALSFLIYYY